MAPRLQLHEILVGLLGSSNVYFQPPNGLEIQYPCIVYKRDFAETEYANNTPYSYEKRYMITHIGRDPDSTVPNNIAMLPKSAFNRFYTADNLNHDVFYVFF